MTASAPNTMAGLVTLPFGAGACNPTSCTGRPGPWGGSPPGNPSQEVWSDGAGLIADLAVRVGGGPACNPTPIPETILGGRRYRGGDDGETTAEGNNSGELYHG